MRDRKKRKARRLRKAPKTSEPLLKTARRLLAKVHEDSQTGCWLWTGCENDKKNGMGYGRVWYQGAAEYAHRLSYFVFVGDIKAELEIGHLCDTPRCINPKHLKQCTHSENIAYKYSVKYYGHGKAITRQLAFRLPEIQEIYNNQVPF